MRFLMRSSSRHGESHLIDLTAHKGNGECSCEDFQMVKLKRLREGEKPSARTICKHIMACSLYFTQAMGRACREDSSPLLAILRRL